MQSPAPPAVSQHNITAVKSCGGAALTAAAHLQGWPGGTMTHKSPTCTQRSTACQKHQLLHFDKLFCQDTSRRSQYFNSVPHRHYINTTHRERAAQHVASPPPCLEARGRQLRRGVDIRLISSAHVVALDAGACSGGGGMLGWGDGWSHSRAAAWSQSCGNPGCLGP